MGTISWQDFEQVDLRVGTIVTAEEFVEARCPAYILHVDFGGDIGVLKSSAQITDLYQSEDLVGQQVIGVVNLPSKQIGPIQSQCFQLFPQQLFHLLRLIFFLAHLLLKQALLYLLQIRLDLKIQLYHKYNIQ